MHECVKIVTLSCRIPTLLLYVGAIRHNSLSDHNSFSSDQFLTQLQPQKTVLEPFFNVETVILLNLFSALLCAFLFVIKNSIYLWKNAPGKGFCIDCRTVLLYFGLWLHYGCHLKGIGTLQNCWFSSLLVHSQLLFEKREERKEWGDWGWKGLGQWIGKHFFSQFFPSCVCTISEWLQQKVSCFSMESASS